jgi:hypothetical protein
MEKTILQTYTTAILRTTVTEELSWRTHSTFAVNSHEDTHVKRFVTHRPICDVKTCDSNAVLPSPFLRNQRLSPELRVTFLNHLNSQTIKRMLLNIF